MPPFFSDKALNPMLNLDQIAQDAAAAFAATDDPDTLEQIKARYLGKSGQITELLKGMAKLSPDEKKSTGAAINRAKEAIESALNARREAIRKQALEARLAGESLDVTLPGRGETRGGLHPDGRFGPGQALADGLGSNIDHVGFALGIQMGQI